MKAWELFQRSQSGKKQEELGSWGKAWVFLQSMRLALFGQLLRIEEARKTRRFRILELESVERRRGIMSSDLLFLVLDFLVMLCRLWF